MSARPFIAAAALLLSACLGLLLWVRSSARPVEPPPRAEAQVPALPGASTPGEGSELVGVVVADSSVDVSARFEGRLQSIEVDVGGKVRRGQVLARLDTAPLESEATMTEADLQAARAEEQVAQLGLAEAQEALARGGDPKLVSVGAMSQEEQARLRYAEQTAQARLGVAQARVRTHQAKLELLRLRMAEASLQAPFDGRVATRYLDAGALVSAGRPILRLLREGTHKVRFAIPEERASRVAVGAPVRIRVLQDGLLLQGRVENVAPEVDAAARMVLAVASLSLPQGQRLPFGTAVRIMIEDGGPVAGSPQP